MNNRQELRQFILENFAYLSEAEGIDYSDANTNKIRAIKPSDRGRLAGGRAGLALGAILGAKGIVDKNPALIAAGVVPATAGWVSNRLLHRRLQKEKEAEIEAEYYKNKKKKK